MKRALALAIGSSLLCAEILAGCASSNPVDNYLRSLDKGDHTAASQIYDEKIKENTDSKSELQSRLNERMDAIYDDFKSGKITADEAKEKLKNYKEYDTSSVYAFTTINKVTNLKESNDSYAAATEAADKGDLAAAIENYKKVIADDSNYETAQSKILQLGEAYTESMKAQAENDAAAKDYDAAVDTITKLENVVGASDELNLLIKKYSELKNYQYIKVVCSDKGQLPENLDKWRFSNYATFVFELTNNSDKPIKGVQGVLHIKDLFGSKIMDVGADFTGHTIQPGETYVNKDLSYEINEFRDTDMKLYNEDYSDLNFEYEPTAIVFSDGTSVTMP